MQILIKEIQSVTPVNEKDFVISPLCLPQNTYNFHWVTGIIDVSDKNKTSKLLYIFDSDYKVNDELDPNLDLLKQQGIDVRHLVSPITTLQGNSKACGYFTIETIRALQSYNSMNDIIKNCQNNILQDLVKKNVALLFEQYGHSFEDLRTKTRYNNLQKKQEFQFYGEANRINYQFLKPQTSFLRTFRKCIIDDSVIGLKSKSYVEELELKRSCSVGYSKTRSK